MDTLRDLFPDHMGFVPSNFYVHIISIAQLQDLTFLRTDQEVNRMQTKKNLDGVDFITRVMWMQRKLTSPQRITGRQLLNEFGFISYEAGKENSCIYNTIGAKRIPQQRCYKCADCILYGYAAQERGSQKARVQGGSLFSLDDYSDSVETYTRVGFPESGTSTNDPNINSEVFSGNLFQDSVVIPEVTFPNIISIKDTTYEGFLYVLYNILATKRYGAVVTKNGSVNNQIQMILISNGDIFGNLHLSKALNTYSEFSVLEVIDRLLYKEFIRTQHKLYGEELNSFLEEVRSLFQDREKCKAMLDKLSAQCIANAQRAGRLKK